MKNCHMFGISPLNGVKKPFFRPEKWHGFARGFYYGRHTIGSPEPRGRRGGQPPGGPVTAGSGLLSLASATAAACGLLSMRI